MRRSQARCVALACCVALAAAHQLSDDLDHSWCFGASPCSLNDKVGSMDVVDGTCLAGNGLTFDGSSCASLANEVLGGDMTIAVWVKLGSVTPKYHADTDSYAVEQTVLHFASTDGNQDMKLHDSRSQTVLVQPFMKRIFKPYSERSRCWNAPFDDVSNDQNCIKRSQCHTEESRLKVVRPFLKKS